MTNEEITGIAYQMRVEYEAKTPAALCKYLDIEIIKMPMGLEKDAIKGLIQKNSRCCSIVLNSDLPERTQNIILLHEIGHYALKHNNSQQTYAFHDAVLFDAASEYEDEANRFVAEYLLDTDETIKVLKENNNFFRAAAVLKVPKEILDYKMRMLRYYNLLTAELQNAESPIYTQRSCMGSIDCSGYENET